MEKLEMQLGEIDMGLMSEHSSLITNNNNNSVAFVQEQTILTERQPLIGEVSADFCG
jgi:hypothetical protein